MPVSIKRNSETEDGAREFPGVTAGKDYPVHGFSGGGAIVINDDGKLFHVGFADLDAGWTVTDEAKKAAADKAEKRAPASAASTMATQSAPAAQTAPAEDAKTTT